MIVAIVVVLVEQVVSAIRLIIIIVRRWLPGNDVIVSETAIAKAMEATSLKMTQRKCTFAVIATT